MKISGMTRIVRELSARGLPRAMPGRHVRDLVRHHARQFGFVIGFQDQPGIDEEESAGKRKGVDLLGVDHLDRERDLGIGIAHQVLAHAIHILGDDRVVDDLGLALDFLRHLLAERDLLFERIEVHPLAYVAVADLVWVFLLVLAACAGRRRQDDRQQNKPCFSADSRLHSATSLCSEKCSFSNGTATGMPGEYGMSRIFGAKNPGTRRQIVILQTRGTAPREPLVRQGLRQNTRQRVYSLPRTPS